MTYTITVADIVSLVATEFGVSPQDIKSARRQANVSEARLVVYWIAKQITPLSFVQIGRALGRRDHSTIITGQQSVEERRSADPLFAVRLDRLLEVCGTVYGRAMPETDPIQAAARIADPSLPGNPARAAIQTPTRDVIAMALCLLDLHEIAHRAAALLARTPLDANPATTDLIEDLQSALIQHGYLKEDSPDDATATQAPAAAAAL
ncbi:helix-turn-helix domain-containing protein [Blastochloris tepida]|uniref:Chromosomal replication initiator DnaA C-terminal domain-containing protein n=1 Tax=Blastochloris tepida TaxID=2233851 RepID=A0A348FYK7_9HYPH|nr:helix-turn-helix domain-containing protein [Blastochloris tepida]BBF92390.1 hypothetical protein BLTE_10750 [Blastochloris tepida]